MLKLIVYFLKFISYIIFIMPQSFRNFCGDCIGILWFDILRLRRKIVFANLQIAFPHKSKKEHSQIARMSLRNMGRAFMNYFIIPFLNEQNVDQYILAHDMHHLDEALKQNKGALLLTLHLGSYDFAACHLSLKNYPLYVISKEFKWKALNDLWFGLRESKKIKFIPDRKSTFEIFRALKEKASVGFVLDQFMGPPLGIPSKFFGHDTGTAMGLAMFALKTEAPVVPVYSYFDEQGRTRFTSLPAVVLEVKETREQSIAYMTQKYSDLMEEIVKQHPEQWMWVHRRWKVFKY